MVVLPLLIDNTTTCITVSFVSKTLKHKEKLHLYTFHHNSVSIDAGHYRYRSKYRKEEKGINQGKLRAGKLSKVFVLKESHFSNPSQHWSMVTTDLSLAIVFFIMRGVEIIVDTV